MPGAGFWRNRLTGEAAVGTCFSIWPSAVKAEVITYSDASNCAWGGHLSVDCQDVVAHGNWLAGEQGHKRSSTWRKLRAVRLVPQATMRNLQGKSVCHNAKSM